MRKAAGTAGRGGARRLGAVVVGRGCAWFAGIVWAHVDANDSTAFLKQKRNSMAALRPLERAEI
jgi:hypothetical protein